MLGCALGLGWRVFGGLSYGGGLALRELGGRDWGCWVLKFCLSLFG